MIENHKGKILEYLVINNETFNKTEIARGLGISRTTLYKWFERNDVPEWLITEFCSLTGVSPGVFKQGLQINKGVSLHGSEKSYDSKKNDVNVILEGNYEKNNSPNLIPRSSISDKHNLTIVPIKAFGGFLTGYANKAYMDSLEHSPWPTIQGECFAFEVEGFSMYKSKLLDDEIYETGYKPGTFVITTQVENLAHLIKKREYIFVTIDGIILKRFEKMDAEKMHLSSINEEYNPVKPLPLKIIKKVFQIVDRNINNP